MVSLLDGAECLIRKLSKSYKSLKNATRKYRKAIACRHFSQDDDLLQRQKIQELSDQCDFYEKEIAYRVAKDNLELMHWIQTERKYDMLHISYGLGEKFSKPHGHIIVNLRKCSEFYNRARDEPHGHQNYIKSRVATNY